MGRDKRPGPVAAHIRIDLSLLNSPAFIALDWTARALFLDLRSRVRSTNNGNIDAALSVLKHRGWASSTTLAKALRQLEAVGLLRKTRQTIGIARGSKFCNLYRFTDLPVLERPDLGVEAYKATCEFKAFKTLTDARCVVSAASTPRKKTALQQVHCVAAESAATGPIDAALSGVNVPQPAAETAASADRQISREANGQAGLAHFQAEIEGVATACRFCTPLRKLPVHTERE